MTKRTSEEGASFTINEQPVPASRPKVSKYGAYYPPAHTKYAGKLKSILEGTPEYPTSDVIEVRILSVMPPYKTSDYPTHRADVDNLAKLPIDCMTKSERYWVDDNLVVSLTSMKRFCRADEEPHTKVRIIPIVEDHGDYVDRQFLA